MLAGYRLQVVDGKTGFLVEPYDIEGCARKVVQILKDPELARGWAKMAGSTSRRISW